MNHKNNTPTLKVQELLLRPLDSLHYSHKRQIESVSFLKQFRRLSAVAEYHKRETFLRAEQSEDLPCRFNSNNSDKNINKLTGEVLADKINLLQPYQKRGVFVLNENCQSFIEAIGINRVGFLTLTFAENLHDNKECSRRFDNLRRRFLSEHFGAWMWVKERQKRGAWHYHILIDCIVDVKDGFDFEGLKTRKYSSANRQLRHLWNLLRVNLPNYGFGRSELLPIKSNVETMMQYVGKYIENHVGQRKPIDKGVRLTGYSRNWKKVMDKKGNEKKELIYSKASPNFSWNSPLSKKWRKNLKLFFVHVMGYPESLWTDDDNNLACKLLKDRFGPSWAYHLQDEIMNIEETLERGEIEKIKMIDGDSPF